jgi:hypothetical protein
MAAPNLEFNEVSDTWEVADRELLDFDLHILSQTVRSLQCCMQASHWLPLLVFVGFSFTATENRLQKVAILKQRRAIDDIVREVALVVQRAFAQSERPAQQSTSNSDADSKGLETSESSRPSLPLNHPVSSTLSWFVQPYRIDNPEESHLREGFMCGWNWLWRSLIKQRDRM